MITVALWFLATLLVVAIVFIAIIIYSRYQELKLKELKQKRIAHNCRIRQREFRDLLQTIQKEGWLNPQQKQPLIMLANNYFVFQTVNEINCSHFYELMNKLDSAISKLKAAPFGIKEDLIEALNNVAQRLPKVPTQYNAQFYSDHAPKIVDNLNDKIDYTIKMHAEAELTKDSSDSSGTLDTDINDVVTMEELEADAFDDYTKRALESHTQRSLSNEN